MKTPRQILLEHYRNAEPKLDRIRREVLSATLPPARSATAHSAQDSPHLIIYWLSKMWLELLWSPRRVWAGFAGVWLVIILLNEVDARQAQIAAAKSASVPAEVLLTWTAQQNLIAELVAQTDRREPGKLKPPPPPPRGERRIGMPPLGRDQFRSHGVAQTCSLPYRRFGIGWVSGLPQGFGLFGAQQNAILRYGRVELCVTSHRIFPLRECPDALRGQRQTAWRIG